MRPIPPLAGILEGLTPVPKIGMSFRTSQVGINGKYNPTLTTAEMEWVKTLYLAEVQYVDDNIGVLVAELKRLGYLRRIPHRSNERSWGRILGA